MYTVIAYVHTKNLSMVYVCKEVVEKYIQHFVLLTCLLCACFVSEKLLFLFFFFFTSVCFIQYAPLPL